MPDSETCLHHLFNVWLGHTYYGYDAVGPLSAVTPDFTITACDVTYGFNHSPASQITTRSTSNDAFVYAGDVNLNRSYSVNGLNQYTSAGSASFSYDANGNLTGDRSNAYVYDVENRLVSALGTSSASLRYDPLGRLYETAGGAAGITQFLYDGDELVAEYNGAAACCGAMFMAAAVTIPWHGSRAQASIRVLPS